MKGRGGRERGWSEDARKRKIRKRMCGGGRGGRERVEKWKKMGQTVDK